MGDTRRGPGRIFRQRSLVVAIDPAAEGDLATIGAYNDVLGFKLRISSEVGLDLLLYVGRLNAGLDRDLVC